MRPAVSDIGGAVSLAARLDLEDRAAERTDHCPRCKHPDHRCTCRLRLVKPTGQVIAFPTKNDGARAGTPDAA